MKHDETVCAVVVTYNREELLEECLRALENQSKPLNAIYIVDNASTYETPQLLREKGYIKEIPPKTIKNPWEKAFKKKGITIHYVRMHENTGGAGGFHEGIKRAYREGYDWLWLMDDDTIVSNDGLKILFSKMYVLEEEVGFLCSKVLWDDDNIHLMNIPQIQPFVCGVPFNKYDDNDLLLVTASSFVSTLLKHDIIAELGFPLKEFFIWGDDIEYTYRITDNNYVGVYVYKSIAYHKTTENYSVDILSDEVKNIWKYSFGIRNNLYILKKRNFILFILYLVYNLTFFNLNILRFRKDNKLKFFWVNTKSTIASIIFKPGKDHHEKN